MLLPLISSLRTFYSVNKFPLVAFQESKVVDSIPKAALRIAFPPFRSPPIQAFRAAAQFASSTFSQPQSVSEQLLRRQSTPYTAEIDAYLAHFISLLCYPALNPPASSQHPPNQK